MSKNRIAKIAALSVGLTLAFGASTAGAQTIADLQAQINALLAQLAALQGGSTTPATPSVTFTQNLTLGSTGSEVSALQQMLVAQGHLVMPAGVAYGYFGPLTQAAVAKWQAANGVAPAVGYWGPISRARYAAMAPTTPGTTTPTTPGAGITTPGVEGTLTVTLNPTPTSGSKVYEGDSRRAVLGLRLEAKTSDIRVERVRVQLPSATFYNRVASRIYVMDGSTVVGSADLNSNTVVREGSNYFITVAGMSYVVPRNSTRVLDLALDFNSSIDSIYRSGGSSASTVNSITVPVDGVRGTDGAGINQFGPSSPTTLTRTFSIESELATSANLKFSLNVNSPKKNDVIAANGANKDELDGLEILRFDVRAEKDNVKIIDMPLVVTGSTSGATTTTVYLYDGSTMLGSGTVGAGGAVTMTNIDYTIPRDTTRTLTVKVDLRDATTTAATVAASVNAGTGDTIVAENTIGDTLADGAKTGGATGETMNVRSKGPMITLVSKSIEKSSVGFLGATSTAKATFNVRVKAMGGDLYFGTQSASSTFAFQTYVGGTASGLANVASSTSWAVPSGVVTSGLATGQSFLLQENAEVTIPVDFLFEGRTAAGALVSTGAYAIGLENVKWSVTGHDTQTSSFMANELDWRTSTVTMP